MNNWFQISYNELGLEVRKEFLKLEDFGESLPFGFIYSITNLENNKFYIGKKQLISVTNKKLGKKELAEQPIKPGRKVTKKKVTSESNWLSYWGSNKILLEDIKQLGYEKFEREIICICPTKKLLTYYEAKYQMQNNVLISNSYNDSIFGHFYRKDFI